MPGRYGAFAFLPSLVSLPTAPLPRPRLAAHISGIASTRMKKPMPLVTDRGDTPSVRPAASLTGVSFGTFVLLRRSGPHPMNVASVSAAIWGLYPTGGRSRAETQLWP